MFIVGLKPLKKRNLYLLYVANRSKILGVETIKYKVISIFIEILGHTKRITLDYLRLATYNIILGLP